jgi:hypothetical protein
MMKLRTRTISAGDAVALIQENHDFAFEFCSVVEAGTMSFGWHGATNADPTHPPVASACFRPSHTGLAYAHFDIKDSPAYIEVSASTLIKIGWHAEVPDDFADDAFPAPGPKLSFRHSRSGSRKLHDRCDPAPH